jgi:hypothetical protein
LSTARGGSAPSAKDPADGFTGIVRIDTPFVGDPPAHGASAGCALTRIAINDALDGREVDWLEHVTDIQYEGT